MPRLFVLSGDDVGHTHDFETALVLGRAKDADMRIRGASISRKHARIEPAGDGWQVIDLGSANGVFVGGKRVKSSSLADGDELRLGDVELRLRTTVPSIVVPKPAPAPLPFGESAAQTQMVPAAESAPVAPVPDEVRDPVRDPAPDPAPDDGFELEGEWSDSPLPPPPVAAPAAAPSTPPPSRTRATPAPDRTAADAATRRAAALGSTAGHGGARATTSGKRILQYHKVANQGGLGGSDLAQQPALVRWTIYILVIALFAGLAWGAFELTRSMRESSSTTVEDEL